MSVILEIMVFCSGIIFLIGLLLAQVEDLSYLRREGSSIELVIQRIKTGYTIGSIGALVYAVVYYEFLEVFFTLAICIVCQGLLTIVRDELG